MTNEPQNEGSAPAPRRKFKPLTAAQIRLLQKIEVALRDSQRPTPIKILAAQMFVPEQAIAAVAKLGASRGLLIAGTNDYLIDIETGRKFMKTAQAGRKALRESTGWGRSAADAIYGALCEGAWETAYDVYRAETAELTKPVVSRPSGKPGQSVGKRRPPKQ